MAPAAGAKGTKTGILICLQVRRALGRKLALALSATLMLYQLGSCAAYLIIVGDTFGSLIAQACCTRNACTLVARFLCQVSRSPAHALRDAFQILPAGGRVRCVVCSAECHHQLGHTLRCPANVLPQVCSPSAFHMLPWHFDNLQATAVGASQGALLR